MGLGLLEELAASSVGGFEGGFAGLSGGRQKLDRGISYERVLQWS